MEDLSQMYLDDFDDDIFEDMDFDLLDTLIDIDEAMNFFDYHPFSIYDE